MMLASRIALAVLAVCGLAGCPDKAEKPVERSSRPALATPPPSPSPSPPPSPSPTPSPTAAPQPAAAGGVDEGKKLYLTGCANCHGPDGTGAIMRQMLPKIGDLTAPELHSRMKDEDIAKLITEGRDKMPPFGSVFKPEQVKAIIQYVRTLKKG